MPNLGDTKTVVTTYDLDAAFEGINLSTATLASILAMVGVASRTIARSARDDAHATLGVGVYIVSLVTFFASLVGSLLEGVTDFKSIDTIKITTKYKYTREINIQAVFDYWKIDDVDIDLV